MRAAPFASPTSIVWSPTRVQDEIAHLLLAAEAERFVRRHRLWRKGWDSNPRYPCRHAGFQDRCLKPLGHPSGPLKLFSDFSDAWGNKARLPAVLANAIGAPVYGSPDDFVNATIPV